MVYLAILMTILYLSYGTLFYGTRNSLSRLGVDWNKWLFMLYMLAQTMLIVPKMFDATPESYQWMVFFIAAGLLITSIAAIDNKDDLKYHYAGAVVACTVSVIWLAIVNPHMLFIPLVATFSGGLNRLQWCGEISIMVAVYITLLI